MRSLGKRQDGPERHHVVAHRDGHANRIADLLALVGIRPIRRRDTLSIRHGHEGSECREKVPRHCRCDLPAVEPAMGGPGRRRRASHVLSVQVRPADSHPHHQMHSYHRTVVRVMRRCDGGAVVSGRLLGLLEILLMRVGSFGYRNRRQSVGTELSSYIFVVVLSNHHDFSRIPRML